MLCLPGRWKDSFLRNRTCARGKFPSILMLVIPRLSKLKFKADKLHICVYCELTKFLQHPRKATNKKKETKINTNDQLGEKRLCKEKKTSNKLPLISSEVWNKNRMLLRKKHSENKNKLLEIKNTTEMKMTINTLEEKVQEICQRAEQKDGDGK